MASMDSSEVETAANALREVLKQIDAGEITASSGQRAHIEGSLAALIELSAAHLL